MLEDLTSFGVAAVLLDQPKALRRVALGTRWRGGGGAGAGIAGGAGWLRNSKWKGEIGFMAESEGGGEAMSMTDGLRLA